MALLASGEAIRSEDRIATLQNLFFDRNDIKPASKTIQIGPIDSEEQRLSIGIGLHTESGHAVASRPLSRLLNPQEYSFADNPKQLLATQFGTKEGVAYALDTDFRRTVTVVKETEINSIFVTARGLNADQITYFWDNIVLTDLEYQVIDALRIISPNIERVNLVSNLFYNNTRIPIVKLTGFDNRVPLKNLGEGMLRILEITLALVNANDGLLLVDEIESGLHYSVQIELWRLILKTARRLNVQVFATTHSWDCIQAFQQATLEDEQAEGMLIRLGRKQGNIAATLFDEQELAIATREQIEVR